ncbi:hypothetical protein RHGRI_020741 [Rhododendron griersonianum]|uniref:Uncharacterized protein n=1 Tax=Rhododendron griersonianum TaxID=479676 RepID=A0AAV6JPX3_9ERIC|nr:hypothetical protein RHGRI_020741 [Rhododendron griersonianum]
MPPASTLKSRHSPPSDRSPPSASPRLQNLRSQHLSRKNRQAGIPQLPRTVSLRCRPPAPSNRGIRHRQTVVPRQLLHVFVDAHAVEGVGGVCDDDGGRD